MNTKLVILMALFSTQAFAQSMPFIGQMAPRPAVQAVAPKVSCSLSYSQNDAHGDVQAVSFAEVLVTESGAESQLKGFDLKGSLRQVCAADGGPCYDVYDLSIELTHSASSSGLFVSVSSSQQPARYSTNLVAGDEEVFVNCDVSPGPTSSDSK